MSEEVDDVEHAHRSQRSQSGGGGAVYGMGLIGALVWYWQGGHGTRGHARAVLKSFLGPAFLVYDVLKALDH